jgi:hypothetical protein
MKLKQRDENSLPNRYAQTIKQIDEGEAVEPKHNPPAKSGDIGDNKQMFYDYVAFADKVNEQLKWGGWRLQEEAPATASATT